jgi:hypothetical protein
MRVPIWSDESIRPACTRSTFRILSAQRQHGLEGAVAALLGRAAGRVALDDEELGLRRIALLAFGELARQRGEAERVLAHDLARLAGRLACLGGLRDLGD